MLVVVVAQVALQAVQEGVAHHLLMELQTQVAEAVVGAEQAQLVMAALA